MTKKIVYSIFVCTVFMALSSGCQRAIPGVKDIIEIWFTHYKGRGETFKNGWGNKQEAETIIQQALLDNALRVISPELATMPPKRGLLNFCFEYAYNGFCLGEENRIYSHVLEFCKKLSDKVI
jgi:hypothetical protein